MDTWGYISTPSASARTGIPSRRTASKNLGQRSSGIVEQKSLFKNLINGKDAVESNYCSRTTKLAKIVISPNLSTIMSIDLGSASWSMEAFKYQLELPISFPFYLESLDALFTSQNVILRVLTRWSAHPFSLSRLARCWCEEQMKKKLQRPTSGS